MRVVLFVAVMFPSELALVYWLMTADEVGTFARRLGIVLLWLIACTATGVWFLP